MRSEAKGPVSNGNRLGIEGTFVEVAKLCLMNILLVGLALSLSPVPPIQTRMNTPEVNADRTVTFRLKAPNAKEVGLNIEHIGGQLMTKSADGTWSFTTKPLAPDWYGYALVVDGVVTLDPTNSRVTPNLIWPGNQFMVKGPAPELWEIQDVPRGQVHRHPFRSKLIGDDREFIVYTPPGYEKSKGVLPVFFLLHGFSDTAVAWNEVGKANIIFDNLLAQKLIKTMIVVMPLGYGIRDFANPSVKPQPYTLTNFPKFQQTLFEEVLPQVEALYRVSKRGADRAIAGLSMGGAQSLYVGLNNIDRFAYIGAFSSGGLPASKPEEVIKGLTPEKGKQLKLLWMACGKQDGLIGFQRGCADWLKSQGMNVQTKETEGGHVWQLWRRNLIEFSHMIFK